jgi:hypothetical protein
MIVKNDLNLNENPYNINSDMRAEDFPKKAVFKTGEHYEHYYIDMEEMPPCELSDWFPKRKVIIAIPIGIYGALGISYTDCRDSIRAQIENRKKHSPLVWSNDCALYKALSLECLDENGMWKMGLELHYKIMDENLPWKRIWAEEIFLDLIKYAEKFEFQALRHRDVNLFEVPINDIQYLGEFFRKEVA